MPLTCCSLMRPRMTSAALLLRSAAAASRPRNMLAQRDLSHCSLNATRALSSSSWAPNATRLASGHQNHHYFSSLTPKSSTKIPPNLKIDPRSTILESTAAAEEYDDHDEEEEEDESTTSEDDSGYEEESGTDLEQDDEVEDEADGQDDESYDDDTTATPFRDEPYYAIPLPDRLYVNVFDKNDTQTSVGTLYLNERVFGHDEIRIDLLQRAVEHHRACVRGRRKAITKTISEVSGSGRKVRPQKGSGRARAGHSRPAHWRGGAKAHGPKGSIQDYSARKLNKKVRKLALTHALSQKLKEGNFILVNDLNLDSHKTMDLVQLLAGWGVGGRHGTSALVLDHVEENDSNGKTQSQQQQQQDDEDEETEEESSMIISGLPVRLVVASGNLHSIQVLHQLRANVYSILKHKKLIMTVSAVQALEERLTKA